MINVVIAKFVLLIVGIFLYSKWYNNIYGYGMDDSWQDLLVKIKEYWGFKIQFENQSKVETYMHDNECWKLNQLIILRDLRWLWDSMYDNIIYKNEINNIFLYEDQS